LVNSRAYNSEKKFSKEESDSAKWTLHFLLDRFLKILYPIVPQITSFIAEDRGENLLVSEWPEVKKKDFEQIFLVDKIMEFNSEVWKKKKEKSISLRDSIKGIKIPDELGSFEKDLVACHGLE
jgi:valyl-tRNA synthetase